MAKKKSPKDVSFAKERNNMLKLMAKNPNYFGTAPDSKYKAVQPLSHNTFYEELTCVGYNPRRNELYATFLIKRDSGYGGTLCTHGSHECVRFYVNYGGGWVDQGASIVHAHDIPTNKDCFKKPEKPLCYVASVKLKDAKRQFCTKESLPRVRAILSWNWCPPPNQPNFNPVWGNRLDCRIQLRPFVWPFPDLDLVAKSDFLPKFLEVATEAPELTVNQITEIVNEDSDQPQSLADFGQPELEVAELAKLYKKGKGFLVEPARFASPALEKISLNQEALEQTLPTLGNIPGLDIADLFKQLDKTKANTSYEELYCLGLDYNRHWLTATFKIKKPLGYGGNLCQKGNKEYIAFWADFNDDCKWEYVGTTAVEVHDLKTIGRDGICYTAVLPVNLDKFRLPCQIPKIVRLRAVLSYAIPPSTTDPDKLNYYGNRLDTHIQLRPGRRPSVHPTYTILGGVSVDQINDVTGLTLPGAQFALSGNVVGSNCPFAQRVVVQGPSFPGHKYRVQVRRVGEASWTDVVKPMWLVGYQPFFPFNPIWTYQAPDPVTHYFDYLPDYKNIDNVLARWDTSGNDLWEVKIDILGIAGSFTHRIRLNHTAPTVSISIGAGGVGDCKDYKPGSKLKGTFTAQSNYLKRFNLGSSVPGGIMIPSTGTSNVPPGPDDWEMTIPAGTKKCGYYVAVNAVDKTIRNSSFQGFHAHDDIGFCVR